MTILTKKRKRKGFTLIELVVVIAILGILMTIAIPKMSGFKDSAALKADQATANSIGKAVELYLLDNDYNGNSITESPSSQTASILDKLEAADLIEKENCKPQYNNENLNFEIIYNENKVKVSYSRQVKVGNKSYKELYPKLGFKND